MHGSLRAMPGAIFSRSDFFFFFFFFLFDRAVTVQFLGRGESAANLSDPVFFIRIETV